ncbi:MAG: polysialyltransferase family glycosyltransferase [Balneolaceae bacterium]
MNRNFSLNDLLEIEECDEILEFKCEKTQIPIWLEVRGLFFRLVKSDKVYTNNNTYLNHRKVSNAELVINLFKSCLYNIFNSYRKESDVLITTSSIGFSNHDDNTNRLSDHFANAHINSLVLLRNKDWKWRKPSNTPTQLFHDPLLIVPSIYAKISAKFYSNQDIIKFVEFLKIRSFNLIGWRMSDEQYDYLIKYISNVKYSLPVKYKLYKRFLEKRKVKVLIGLTLCYGSSALVVAAKDLKIVVAEYQHGVVSSGHTAYNFSQALCSSELVKRVLPSHFLGYGKWWNESFNAPIEKHIIGNPHRSEQLKKYYENHKNENNKKRNNILILGDGFETERYIEFAINLNNKLHQYDVVFRPHPRERTHMQKLIDNKYKNSTIIIDDERDIYSSFLFTDIVISELSTGLFEAIGLVNRIFIWRTDKSIFALPDIPIATFSSLDDLINKIIDKKEGYTNALKENELWATDWKSNYLNFLYIKGNI